MVIDWDNFWDLFPFRWGPLRPTMKNWRNWVSWSYESEMILVIRDGSYKMVQLQRRGNILNKSVHLNQPLYAFVFLFTIFWRGCTDFKCRPKVWMMRMPSSKLWEAECEDGLKRTSERRLRNVNRWNTEYWYIWWNKILKYGRWKKYVLLQRTQDSRFLILGVLQVWNDFDIKSWVVWNHRRSEWSWLPLRLLYALPGPDARWCTPHELSWKGKHPKKILQFVT